MLFSTALLCFLAHLQSYTEAKEELSVPYSSRIDCHPEPGAAPTNCHAKCIWDNNSYSVLKLALKDDLFPNFSVTEAEKNLAWHSLIKWLYN